MRPIKSIAILLAAPMTLACAADDMTPFPPAESGMTRYVIRLPTQKDENGLKVELIIGKIVMTDPKNNYFFSGALKTEDIPGWGFNRYIVRDPGVMAGTLMAVDPNAPKVKRFISLGGETILRYNSRLPLVVYVPVGFEVRYRIWQAEPILLAPGDDRRQ